MLRYLPFIALLALIVYALVDCVRHDESEMPVGLPKAIWVILIIVFPAAGAIAWLVVSRVGQSRARQTTSGGSGPGPGTYGPASRGRGPRPGQRAPRPVAPDDDPDFLASLNRPQRPDDQDPSSGADKDAPEGADTGAEQAADDDQAAGDADDPRTDQGPSNTPGDDEPDSTR